MHYELRILFVLYLSVDCKYLVLTIISDLILLYDGDQRNNICDGSLARPNIFVVTHHFCLVGQYHFSTVALKLHNAAGL